MSELNFKEIEKAMAELVNKAQGQQREKQLNSVVRKRDQITKKKEDKIGQGMVATKRIIIGNKGLRANLTKQKVTSTIPTTAKANPISDFRLPAPRPLFKEEPLTEVPDDYTKGEPTLDQTVGDLSNQYLSNVVSKPYEPEFTETNLSLNEVTDKELNSLDTEKETNSPDPLPDNAEIQEVQDSKLNYQEDQTSSVNPSLEDNLPESEELTQSLDDPTYDRGAVHRIYGQKMPTHNPVNSFAKDKGSQDIRKDLFKPDSNKQVKLSKSKKKHGLLFFLVILLALASIATWGLAIYLYISPQ